MKSIKITLNSIDVVKAFVGIVSQLDGDCDLVSERYVVDAKSIMGVLSLDLSKELSLQFHNDGDYDKAAEALSKLVAL